MVSHESNNHCHDWCSTRIPSHEGSWGQHICRWRLHRHYLCPNGTGCLSTRCLSRSSAASYCQAWSTGGKPCETRVLGTTVLDEEEKKKALQEAEVAKKQLTKAKRRQFEYSHQGSLAYIGSEKAIADLPFMNGNVGGPYLFFFLLFSQLLFLSSPPLVLRHISSGVVLIWARFSLCATVRLSLLIGWKSVSLAGAYLTLRWVRAPMTSIITVTLSATNWCA